MEKLGLWLVSDRHRRRSGFYSVSLLKGDATRARDGCCVLHMGIRLCVPGELRRGARHVLLFGYCINC